MVKKSNFCQGPVCLPWKWQKTTFLATDNVSSTALCSPAVYLPWKLVRWAPPITQQITWTVHETVRKAFSEYFDLKTPKTWHGSPTAFSWVCFPLTIQPQNENAYISRPKYQSRIRGPKLIQNAKNMHLLEVLRVILKKENKSFYWGQYNNRNQNCRQRNSFHHQQNTSSSIIWHFEYSDTMSTSQKTLWTPDQHKKTMTFLLQSRHFHMKDFTSQPCKIFQSIFLYQTIDWLIMVICDAIHISYAQIKNIVVCVSNHWKG